MGIVAGQAPVVFDDGVDPHPFARLVVALVAKGVALFHEGQFFGVAGIIMAPIWGVRPHVGIDAVIPAFVVVVMGGVGSFWGAVSAGVMVGMVVALIMLIIGSTAWAAPPVLTAAASWRRSFSIRSWCRAHL